MNRFSLSVSAQFESGQPRPKGLSQLADELMELTWRVDFSRHSTQNFLRLGEARILTVRTVCSKRKVITEKGKLR